MLKAIIFDMGSTLIEFENYTWDALGRMGTNSGYKFLKSRDIVLPEYNIFEMMLSEEFGQRLAIIKENPKEIKFEEIVFPLFEKLKISTSDGNFTNFLYEYYKPITQQATLIEGALDILQYFKEKQLKVGLISNTVFPADFHRDELKRFGLYSFLDISIFSCEFGYRKPYPKIYQEGLGQLEVKANETVFVGDRLVEDVGGPQELGMKAVLKYKEGRDYSAPIKPDVKVDSLTQLPQAIEELKWD